MEVQILFQRSAKSALRTVRNVRLEIPFFSWFSILTGIQSHAANLEEEYQSQSRSFASTLSAALNWGWYLNERDHAQSLIFLCSLSYEV